MRGVILDHAGCARRGGRHVRSEEGCRAAPPPARSVRASSRRLGEGSPPGEPPEGSPALDRAHDAAISEREERTASKRAVVGGQYGSEGKGKVVTLLAAERREPCVVRCGGPNSGHTTHAGGTELVLRQVPAAAAHPGALLMLAAGCAVDVDILLEEVEKLGLARERIVVDPRAVLISDRDRLAEAEATARIGSTASGTGSALARRMSRVRDMRLAADSDVLCARVRVASVAPLLHDRLERGGDVIVEGTQGFGLSLLHGFHYPYVTARDTTAAGFASEVGLSPRHIDSITMVVRTFPIRVGGNSGPIDDEITWDVVRDLSGAPETMPEYTSVTRRLRRVAHFNLHNIVSACQYNRPTSLAVMGLDRLEFRNTQVRERDHLSPAVLRFLADLERTTNVAIGWVGTGFGTSDAFRLSGTPDDRKAR